MTPELRLIEGGQPRRMSIPEQAAWTREVCARRGFFDARRSREARSFWLGLVKGLLLILAALAGMGSGVFGK